MLTEACDGGRLSSGSLVGRGGKPVAAAFLRVVPVGGDGAPLVLERIARPSTDPASRSAVGIILTPTGDERCREPAPPTCASGCSTPTRVARGPVRGRAALPGRRAHALGLAEGRRRGGPPRPGGGARVGGGRETLAGLV